MKKILFQFFTSQTGIDTDPPKIVKNQVFLQNNVQKITLF